MVERTGSGRLRRLRSAAGVALDARAWRPAHARLLLRNLTRWRNQVVRADDQHLHAAARWLARAQDVMPDGGFAGRYSLETGWTSSYPETTGYIIPTLLDLTAGPGMDAFRERAARAVRFLLRTQLADGAFPGGEIAENRTAPSIFNSGQILHGLVAWHRATEDGPTHDAARRAADWLASEQERDGTWRRHVYNGIVTTYTAHASCWLAEAGAYFHEARYRDAARRHLLWALSHVEPRTGWVDLAGFDASEHDQRIAVTHTIAYTLRGLLVTSDLLGIPEGIAAVRRAALAIADTVQAEGWLPGVLDWQWRGRSDFACVTGNAQMAQVWLHLHALEPESRFLAAAARTLELVKTTQLLAGTGPDIRGAIPGSDPLWGSYLRLSYPNWAAKFFIDALLAWRRATRATPDVSESAAQRAAWCREGTVDDRATG